MATNVGRPAGGLRPDEWFDPSAVVDGSGPTPAMSPTLTPEVETPTYAASRPAPIMIPKAVAKTEAVHQGYLEIVERLEQQIAEQLAAVQKVMEAEKLGPNDIAVVYAQDITGGQKRVCSFCGSPGCGYRPVMYRTQNAEIDLEEDALVVALELSRRTGIAVADIVYDEQVLVLREPAPLKDANEAALVLSRFRAFNKRYDTPDPTNRAWLDAQLAKWQCADATKKMAGEPDDRHMLKVAEQLLAKSGRAVKGLTLSKSQAQGSLRAHEKLLKAKGITVSGIAVGKNAAAVASCLFTKTTLAPDAHQLRLQIGKGIASLLSKIDGLTRPAE